jgi:hypothetical protein
MAAFVRRCLLLVLFVAAAMVAMLTPGVMTALAAATHYLDVEGPFL